jgi:hypothetical protein
MRPSWNRSADKFVFASDSSFFFPLACGNRISESSAVDGACILQQTSCYNRAPLQQQFPVVLQILIAPRPIQPFHLDRQKDQEEL